MEATGVYWKAPWAILEDEFECLLVNARHVKQIPRRKTDVSDAAWLCQLAEAGLLKASFVPPKPIRQLRNLTRYRKTQIQERQGEVNRLHKALDDARVGGRAVVGGHGVEPCDLRPRAPAPRETSRGRGSRSRPSHRLRCSGRRCTRSRRSRSSARTPWRRT